MAQTLGRVLYRTVFRTQAGTVLPTTYSGTITSGFPVANAFDWRDWSLFRVSELVTTLTVVATEVRIIDTFGWYVVLPDLAAGDYTMTLAWRVDNVSAWIDLVTIDLATNGLLGIAQACCAEVPIGGEVRVTFTIPAGEHLDVRCLAAGQALEFPIGQHEGIAPPHLQGQFASSNNISVNGSFVGRDLIRKEIAGSIELEYLTPAWVRTFWSDFQTHTDRYSFFYAWDYDDRPGEVVFAWRTKDPSPVNASPTPRMSVNMEWGGRIEPLPTVPFQEDADCTAVPVPVENPESILTASIVDTIVVFDFQTIIIV